MNLHDHPVLGTHRRHFRSAFALERDLASSPEADTAVALFDTALRILLPAKVRCSLVMDVRDSCRSSTARPKIAAAIAKRV